MREEALKTSFIEIPFEEEFKEIDLEKGKEKVLEKNLIKEEKTVLFSKKIKKEFLERLVLLRRDKEIYDAKVALGLIEPDEASL